MSDADPAPAAPLDAEDAKLVTLARTTRVRVGTAQAAAVRDDTGRTYAAAEVSLPSLTLTALQAAVTLAVASGARGLEGAATVGDPPSVDEVSMAAMRELAGTGVRVHLAGPDGALRGVLVT